MGGNVRSNWSSWIPKARKCTGCGRETYARTKTHYRMLDGVRLSCGQYRVVRYPREGFAGERRG